MSSHVIRTQFGRAGPSGLPSHGRDRRSEKKRGIMPLAARMYTDWQRGRVMKRTFVLAGLLVFGCAVLSYAQVKCEANINGFKIHTVYIMGDQYNGVVWAYKHIAEETCLTPSTDLSKADAILEVHRTWTPGSKADTAPLTVSCSSIRNSTVCSDSTGNELTVDCTGGAGFLHLTRPHHNTRVRAAPGRL